MSYQIRVNCTCGKVLKIPEKYAGRRGRCPNCGKKIAIPSMEDIKNKIQSQKDPEERNCPVCGAYLNPGDNICVSCHANLATGEWEAEPPSLQTVAPSRKMQFIGAFAVLAIFILLAGKILVSNFNPPQNDSKSLKPLPPTQTEAPENKGIKSAIKSLLDMPENTLEAVEQKIAAFDSFMEEQARIPKAVELYAKMMGRKKELEAMAAHQALPNNHLVTRWFLLEKTINQFQGTHYASEKLKEEQQNVEKQMISLARKQAESIRELSDDKKKQESVLKTLEYLAQTLKQTCPIEELQKEIDSIVKECGDSFVATEKTLAAQPPPQPKDANQELLEEMKKEFNDFLPAYREYVDQSDFRKALAKINPIVKQANDLVEKYPEDAEIKKIMDTHAEISLLNKAWDYALEGIEVFKGKEIVLFPKDRKEKPFAGMILDYQDGHIHVKNKEGILQKVSLKDLSSLSIKDLASGNTAKNPEVFVALACLFYMNQEEKACRDACEKAIKMGAAKSEVESYLKWADGMVQEKNQQLEALKQRRESQQKEDEAKAEEARMERLRKKASRIVENILKEYKKRPTVSRDIAVLELLISLKEQVGDEPNGRDELIKISKDTRTNHGQSLPSICDTVYEHCDYCQNSGEVQCPSCKGEGVVETDGRWLGKVTPVKIDGKKKYCEQCKGKAKVVCPECASKRLDRRYKMIKSYYGNF